MNKKENNLKKLTAISLLKREIAKIKINGGNHRRLQRAVVALRLIENNVLLGYQAQQLQNIGNWVESLL